jgi:O-antigen ligase
VPPPLSWRERAAIAAFGLAPVAFLPGALNRFVFPKVALAALGCSLAAWPPRRGRLPRVVSALLGAGAVILLVAAATSASVTGALLGRAPRYEGVFVLPVYAASAAAGAWLLGPGRRRAAVPWCLRWLTVAAVVIAIEAILETAGLRPLASDVARPGSLLGNASDEGAIGVLLLGPLAGAAITARDRWCIAGSVAAAAVVVLSASRGALVAVVPLAFVLAAALVRKPAPAVGTDTQAGLSRSVRLRVAGGVTAVAVAAFALPFTRSRILGLSPLAAHTVSGRWLLWQETVRLVAQRWWLGIGPSGFLDGIGVEHDRTWQSRFGGAFPPDSPHNWVLQAAGAGGVLLAVLAVVLAAVVLWRGWLSIGQQTTIGEAGAFAGLLAGVTGYGAALMFHLTSPGTTPLAAFCAGALLAGPAATSAAASGSAAPQRLGRMAPVLTAISMAALAVLLGLAALAEIPLRAAVNNLSAGQLSSAEHNFEVAHALRPWDWEIDQTAGHAFVVAAQSAAAPASEHALVLARPWVAAELDAYPDSTEAIEDAAAVAQLSGHLREAAGLLTRAAALDPLDPQILLGQGVVAGQRHRWGDAVRWLLESASIDERSPAPWQALATVYRSQGLPDLARAAEDRAERLAR